MFCLVEMLFHMLYSRWCWSPAFLLAQSNERRMSHFTDADLHGDFGKTSL